MVKNAEMPVKFTRVSTKELLVHPSPALKLHATENNIGMSGTFGHAYLFFFDAHEIKDQVKMPFTLLNCALNGCAPISKLLTSVSLERVYNNSTLAEKQHLVLDPMLAFDCSRRPPKPRAILVSWIPSYYSSKQYCIVLTSLGDCRIYHRNVLLNYFREFDNNLNSILSEMVPKYEKEATEISTFAELLDYTNRYHITAFCCAAIKSSIFLGTAAGIIACLKFNPDNGVVIPNTCVTTDLGYIAYMTCIKDYLAISNIKGIVKLYEIVYTPEEDVEHVNPLLTLWDVEDRIPCQNIFITDLNQSNSMLVVFYKASCIIANVITSSETPDKPKSKEYAIRWKTEHILPATNITGIQVISEGRYMVSSMCGKLMKVVVTLRPDGTLQIKDELLIEGLDVNMRILTFVTSYNSIFWTFLMSRIMNIPHRDKKYKQVLYYKVFKMENLDLRSQFTNTTKEYTADIFLGLKMDFLNEKKQKSCCFFMKLTKRAFMKNDNPIPMIQAAYFTACQWRAILRPSQYTTKYEMEFFKSIIQSQHILSRMSYLCSIKRKTNLTLFQRISIKCMRFWYITHYRQIKTWTKVPKPCLSEVAIYFAKHLKTDLKKYKFTDEDLEIDPHHLVRKCVLCGGEFNVIESTKCNGRHQIKRCGITCTPMSMKRPFLQCTMCNERFLQMVEGELMEVYPEYHKMRCCPFCKSGLQPTYP